MDTIKPLFTATATATGGRNGHTQSSDGIVKADRIYVLKEGRIVQSGRYDQLLAEAGPFRELARRQML